MPRICEFFGILIYMYYHDHGPAHFHAIYGDHEVLICIENFSVLQGSLPPKALALVIEWAEKHQNELLRNWNLALKHKTLKKIRPLE